MRLGREEVSARVFAATALVVVACHAKEPDAPPAITLPPPPALAPAKPILVVKGDVCHIPESDMCLAFDGRSAKNATVCADFATGELDRAGTCADALRIGSCRVAADALKAIYFGGDNNDVLDSAEHCQETLHGSFKPTPRNEIVATWNASALDAPLTGYTMLMPAQTVQEPVGSGLSLERYTGYFGVIIEPAAMSVAAEKRDAVAGSDWFKFDAWVSDGPGELVWSVRAAKSGAIGYKFAVEVHAGGAAFTCESLTVFDDVELMNANLDSCRSLTRR
ncbi:hypothetical protein BH09MYX1_BH09MYX1_13840 [soil metagenome]